MYYGVFKIKVRSEYLTTQEIKALGQLCQRKLDKEQRGGVKICVERMVIMSPVKQSLNRMHN